MGNEIKATGSVTTSTFQSFDGSNYTLTNVDGSLKYKRVSVGAAWGIGTDFNDTNVVTDLKASLNYDKNGRFNQNLRIRNKISDDVTTTQVRYSPLSINVPINESLSIYANPHYVAQKNDIVNEWQHSAGIFVGATKRMGKISVSAEIQRYNLQDINDNSGANWSGNVIVSYKF